MKKIKVLFIINFLFLILFCFEFNKTYSVFESDVVMDVSNKLAIWKVFVNDIDITMSNTFDMANISWNTSEKVLTGKAAPGLAGFFDIVISPGDTEVAFRYDVKFDFSGISNQEFVLISVTDANGGYLVRTDRDVYSGIFTLNDIDDGYIADIKVDLIWNDNENNNETDYELGSIKDNQFVIPVEVHIIQSTNLELIEYVDD